MNLKKKKKGFTLIELMAVIAIIAILAAVLVPTVSGYINRAKKTAVINQVRNLVNAVETYNITASDDIELEDGTDSVTIVNGKLPEDMKVEIDKLGNMTADEAYTINNNADAVNKIQLSGDIFATYAP